MLDCVLPLYFFSLGPHLAQLVESSSEYEESLTLEISGTVATVILKNNNDLKMIDKDWSSAGDCRRDSIYLRIAEWQDNVSLANS